MKLSRWSYIALAVPLILAMGFAGASLADKPKPQIETVPEGGIIEVTLDQAIRKHGEYSHQANDRRRDLTAERERCWRESHAWWDAHAHQWHSERDWDSDHDHDHDNR